MTRRLPLPALLLALTGCSAIVAGADIERPVLDCGDGVTQPPEMCDTGGVDTNTCNGATCTLSACGDGYLNGASAEACDDGNVDTCGTCNATCSVSITPAAATGFILAVGGAQLVDGETFTLSDGINPPVVFEFDTDASVSAGRVAVEYGVGDAADLMAMAIEAAVNTLPAGRLEIGAARVGGRVDLMHALLTAAGNVAITETVAVSAFTVSGMAGGAAGDCPPAMGCATDADCYPPNGCGPTSKTCGGP